MCVLNFDKHLITTDDPPRSSVFFFPEQCKVQNMTKDTLFAGDGFVMLYTSFGGANQFPQTNQNLISFDMQSLTFDVQTLLFGNRSLLLDAKSLSLDVKGRLLDVKTLVLDVKALLLDVKTLTLDVNVLLLDVKALLLDVNALSLDVRSIVRNDKFLCKSVPAAGGNA